MNPSIRQLEALALVYKLGSVSKAADRMFISQSAVSILLRQLETTLDTKLFDRTTRHLQPTAAAHEAVASANRILHEIDCLANAMRRLADKSVGKVKFGVTAALAASIFPSILKDFSKQYPNVAVVAKDVPHDQLSAMVLDDEVEFAIGGPPESSEPELLYREVASYAISAIDLKQDRSGKERNGRQTVKWADVLSGPTIAISRGGIRDQIDRTLHEHGIEFHPTYEAQFLPTALAMTAEGLGVSILPGYLCPANLYASLRVRTLCEPMILRRFTVISRKDRSLSAAAEAFVAMAIERIRRDLPNIDKPTAVGDS